MTRRILKEQEITNSDRVASITDKRLEAVTGKNNVFKIKNDQGAVWKTQLATVFDQSNIPEDQREEYYVSKDLFDEYIENSRLSLGKTGKELDIGKNPEKDPFTYKELGGDKYKIVSGPDVDQINKEFTVKKNTQPAAEKDSDNQSKEKETKQNKPKAYEFTPEQLAKLPKDLNQKTGDQFREWVNNNKSKKDIAAAFKDLDDDDKTLGRKGDFDNDHIKLAYLAFKDEYEKYLGVLEKLGTDGGFVYVGEKPAGNGMSNSYHKLYIDDIAVAIDSKTGETFQRTRGKGENFSKKDVVKESKRRKTILRESRIDPKILNKKLLDSFKNNTIKGLEKASSQFKDLVKKKSDNVKKAASSTKKSKSKKSKIDTSKIEAIFLKYARKEGFTPEDTPEVLAAIMAVIDKESRWKPAGERSYSKTKAIRVVGSDLYLNPDGSEKDNPNPKKEKGFDGMSALFHLNIKQIDALKSDDKEFFSYVYGDGKERTVNGVFIPKAYTFNEMPATNIAFRNMKKGKSIEGLMYKDFIGASKFKKNLAKAQEAENKDAKLKNREPVTLKSYAPVFHHRLSHDLPEPDDGYKYRGHGLNQLTGKANYQKYDKLGIAGIADNPSVLDEPEKASEVAALFLCRGIKKMLGLKGTDPQSLAKQIKEKGITSLKAVQAAAGVNAGMDKPNEKYAAAKTQEGFEKYMDKFKSSSTITENKKRKTKMISENQLRKLVREALLQKENKKINRKVKKEKNISETANVLSLFRRVASSLNEATEKFADHIKDETTGNEFRKWVNDNHKDVAQRIDLDPQGEFNNSYITKAWDELGDEYVKSKNNPQSQSNNQQQSKEAKKESKVKFEDFIKDPASGNKFRKWVNDNHPEDAKRIDLSKTGPFDNSYTRKAWSELGDEYAGDEKRAKNLKTGGKYVFVPGKEESDTHKGTGEKGNGVNGNFFKFYKDNVTIAIEKETGTIKQRLRGKGGKFSEVMRESRIKLIENILGKKLSLKENFINPAKIAMDLKNSDNIVVPSEEGKEQGITSTSLSTDSFYSPIEKSEKKYKSKSMPSSKTNNNLDKNKKEKSPPNPDDHDFYIEEDLPIKFEQLDMSECAETAKSLLAEWGDLTEKTGFDFLYNKICKPVHAAFGGNWPGLKNWVKGASNDVSGHAWSSWFLNRCLVSNSTLLKLTQSLQDGYEAKGMVYPWSVGNKNRISVVKDMEKSIGTTKLMMFSREEIENRSDLDFKPGIFTLNSYSGKADNFKSFKKTTEHQSGFHMNVVTSQGPIGGNRGDAGVINNKGSIKQYNCYYILVKVLPNKPNLA